MIINGSGIAQQAASKHRASPPEFKGRHLWVFAGVWSVANPAAEVHHCDMENLLTIEGPGCFWCEQEWVPTLGAHCPGRPS